MQKVKVTAGIFVGLVGWIVRIDHSWPAPYAIRYGTIVWWFYAEELEAATAQDAITVGRTPEHQKQYENRFIPIRDNVLCADGKYRYSNRTVAP